MGALVASYISSGVPVDSAVASEGTVSKLVSESGTVESRSAVLLTAKLTGEIRGILVEEGDSGQRRNRQDHPVRRGADGKASQGM